MYSVRIREDVSTISDATTVTSVNVATSSVQLIGANPNRKGMRIYNNSSNSIYLTSVSPANSGTNLFAIVATFTAFEFNNILYRGPVYGIRNAGTGAVITTEFI